jgi:integrase
METTLQATNTDASLRSVVNQFLTDCETRQLSKVHIKTVKSRMKRPVTLWGDRHINDITKDDLESYLRSIDSSETALNHLRTLSSVFAFAKNADLLPWGSRDVTQRIRRPKKTRRDPEFFTPEEMRALLRAAAAGERGTHYQVAMLVLGGFVGLRTEEVMRIQWEDILLDHKIARLHGDITKTSRRRMARLPDNAVAWLRKVERASGPVVTESVRDALYRREDIQHAAGVVWKNNGLRHSYVTYSMALERNAFMVAEQVGNSPGVLHEHYMGLVLPTDAEEWFGITPDNTL